MLKVASISWSFADDIVFNNIALVLYANGCRWACPGCHNKQLQCFESIDKLRFEDNNSVLSYIRDKIDTGSFLNNKLTIVGSGGDFFFQLPAWLDLCSAIKREYPWIKILWYTGAEHTNANIAMLDRGLHLIDAILWGKLKNSNGYVIKDISRKSDMHESTEKIRISEYNTEFENIIEENIDAQ